MRILYNITGLAFCLTLMHCNPDIRVQSTQSKYVELGNESPAQNHKLDKLIAPYSDQLEEKMSEVINSSDISMAKARPEGLLSNFVADLVYEETVELGKYTADFCLLNHGGLRAPLPKGDITIRHIYELMPFENEVVILEISGEKVLLMADYLSYTGGEPISNASLTLKDNSSFKVNGEPVDPNRTYHVITSDYLAKGGDRMDLFFGEPINMIKTGIKIRDMILEHILEEKEAGRTLNAKLDGRLS